MNVPVIDVSALSEAPWPMQSPDAPTAAVADVARQIDSACREVGFFTIVGHGIDPGLLTGLEERCRRFFALPEAEKARISMSRGGRAWRGWFPLDRELTSGAPDHKEGVYFGQCSELCGKDHAYMPITVKVVSEEAYAAWLARTKTAALGTSSPIQVASSE